MALRRHARPLLLSVEFLESRELLAAGDLRIVTYNITSSATPPRNGLSTILQGIANEVVGGRSQPIDVLLLQEVQNQSTTTQVVTDLLNGIYGPGTYGRSTLNGAGSGGTQGLVYRLNTVQLLGQSTVGTASGSGQPRQTLRYRLQPLGMPQAEFYVYNSHYKASSTATDQQRRLTEANAIRVNSDALGEGVNIIYAGDFNVYSSNESAYQRLLSSGPGQAFDPINTPGNWHTSTSVAFRPVFTQAPAINPPAPLVGGGLDDRFDFQLISGELTDGRGLEYVPGSYHAFGNNGSLPVNSAINNPNNTALPGLPNRTPILNLLTTVSDHLPVVADYRVVPTTTIAGFTVNDGLAQRSMVSSLTVSINGLVTIDPSAFALFSNTGLVSTEFFAYQFQGWTYAYLYFTGPEVIGGSLADGDYTLISYGELIRDSSGRQIDADGDGVAGGFRADAFFRYYGDADGDRDVDDTDYAQILSTYGLTSGQLGFLAYFDFNGDSFIGDDDFNQFVIRYGTSL